MSGAGRAVASALTLVYVGAALVHGRLVNRDPSRHDQATYLAFSQELARSGFAAPTNRSQMPAYLYLQALFVDPQAPGAAAFERAKLVNIGLSVILLALLAVFFARSLPRREARLAILVTAFTVFVFRAAYVQAELLFYTAAFFGFAALCRLWTRPSFSVAVLAGLLEAAAFLTKGSAHPGLLLFAALFLARAAWTAWRDPSVPAPLRLRALGADVARTAVLLGSFLAPLAPYLARSRELYGSWFFNVNTRFVMWTDSWDDFRSYEARLGGWWTWGRLPESELPSMAHYLASHSLLAILKRELLGVGEVLGNALLGHGYFEFLALELAFAAVASGFVRSPWRALRAIDPRSPAAFALPYAALYTLLFGFYAPIAGGARFILMLFLPVLYSLLRAGADRAPVAALAGRSVPWSDFTRFVLVLAVLHVLFILPMTIGRLYAGG